MKYKHMGIQIQVSQGEQLLARCRQGAVTSEGPAKIYEIAPDLSLSFMLHIAESMIVPDCETGDSINIQHPTVDTIYK